MICVLQSLEDGILNGHATLAQLHLDRLSVVMDVLHPHVMVLSCPLCDVLLEDDHIRVRDVPAIDASHNRGNIIVDGIDDDWRASRQ